jgi:hypothetical protein
LEEAAMRKYEDSKESSTMTPSQGAFFVKNCNHKRNFWKQRTFPDFSNSKFKSYQNATTSNSGALVNSNSLICHYYGKENHIRSNCQIIA